MKTKLPSGIYTALITPFLKDGSIDFGNFEKLVQFQIQSGVSGVIPCGTTGESPTLSLSEKRQLIERTIALCQGTPVQVVAGTGSNNTQETVELSEFASKKGAQAVLVVVPYYNKPTPKGLHAHFTAVADRVQCEVMLYNVPGRTGTSLTAKGVSELAAHPKICSIKEATGNLAFASEIRDALRHPLSIFSGDDPTFYPLLSLGASGIVSVASNLIPKLMVELFRSAASPQGLQLHERLFPLFRDLFVEANPIPIKWAMSRAGYGENILRLPLVPISAEAQKVLETALNKAGL